MTESRRVLGGVEPYLHRFASKAATQAPRAQVSFEGAGQAMQVGQQFEALAAPRNEEQMFEEHLTQHRSAQVHVAAVRKAHEVKQHVAHLLA